MQLFHVRPFPDQETAFLLHAARVSCQAAVRSHHPVTGNDDGDGIVAHRAAHGLGTAVA